MTKQLFVMASDKRFCKKCSCETHRYKNGQCKPCKDAKSKAWRENNKEYMSQYLANWRKENPESPEKSRARQDKWRAKNPEKSNLASAEWKLRNPSARRIQEQNRRARKRANGGELSRGLSAKLFKLQRGKCACGCGHPLGDNYHLDHIMPVRLGGTNTDDNIQLLRSTCNQQKHAKHPIEFMQQRGFLL